MKIEELQIMSHEDLVIRVKELEEENEKLAAERDNWFENWRGMKEKFSSFRDAVKNIVVLVD